MRLVLIDGPNVEPLSVAEAKARLNLGNEVPDVVVSSFITASRQQLDGVDGWLGRALNTQKWRGTLDEFPCDKIEIPLPPLQEVTSVGYVGADGTLTVMDPSLYQVVQGPRPYIVSAYGSKWPALLCRTDSVTIEFTAGYGDAPDSVPEPIRTAIALGVTELRSLSAQNLYVSQIDIPGVMSKRFTAGIDAGAVLNSAAMRLISSYRVQYV